MASYELAIRRSVSKDLRQVPADDLRRLLKRIKGLAQDPRPRDTEKLSGKEHYRIRQGRYRILYEIDDRQRRVTVVKVGHRRDVYRRK